MRRVSESLDVSTKLIEAAEESARLAGTRYSSGVGTIVELTDAQVDLASARATRVRLLADHQIGFAQLEYAVGGTVTEEHAPR
jgi:outer membrane protein TolC